MWAQFSVRLRAGDEDGHRTARRAGGQRWAARSGSTPPQPSRHRSPHVAHTGRAGADPPRLGPWRGGTGGPSSAAFRAENVVANLTGRRVDPVIQAGVEGVFGSLSFVDLVDDVVDEVGVSVGDDGFVVGGLGFFAGPGGLSGGAVAVQAGSGGGDPVPET